MAKHKAQAPNFREGGGVKEFILEDGRTYLIFKFPDWSILVLQKVKGTKEASAEYKPIKAQKNILRKLGYKEGTFYQMGAEIFKDC